MVLVTGLLQGVVEVKGIFFINIDWSQVCASTEPPLLSAWNTHTTHRQGSRKQGLSFIHVLNSVTDTKTQLLMSRTDSHTLTIFFLDLKISVVEVHCGDVGVLGVDH